MTLTAKDVAEITRLLEESSFDELYLEIDGLKLSLKRGAAANTQAPVPSAGPGAAANPTPVADPTPAAPTSQPNSPVKEVRAPLLGTFYRAPKPGAPPFVEVGALVEEDTIIGILEVMKLMNTIRAGLRGKVIEIVAHDGTLVEYGEPLMRVSTSDSGMEIVARG